jgi:ATP synthase protein I
MSERGPADDLQKLDARLKRATDEARETGAHGLPRDKPAGSALGLALRVGVELVSALAVGLAIGWLLDAWLGTRPWLMLVFILLGGAAGILNVYRMARGFGYAVGYNQDKPTGRGRPGDQGPGIEG